MSRVAGPFGVIAVVIMAVAFASQNGAERVTLDFGLFVLYGVPVTLVAFGGLFVGMLVMLGAGIQSDLKVRAILRQRLAEEDADAPELTDQSQRDLFLHAPPFDPEDREGDADPSVEPWLAEDPTHTEFTSDLRPPDSLAASADPLTEDVPLSIDDLAPTPQPIEPLDEPDRPAGHPSWRDMEHGDPMD